MWLKPQWWKQVNWVIKYSNNPCFIIAFTQSYLPFPQWQQSEFLQLSQTPRERWEALHPARTSARWKPLLKSPTSARSCPARASLKSWCSLLPAPPYLALFQSLFLSESSNIRSGNWEVEFGVRPIKRWTRFQCSTRGRVEIYIMLSNIQQNARHNWQKLLLTAA